MQLMRHSVAKGNCAMRNSICGVLWVNAALYAFILGWPLFGVTCFVAAVLTFAKAGCYTPANTTRRNYDGQ